MFHSLDPANQPFQGSKSGKNRSNRPVKGQKTFSEKQVKRLLIGLLSELSLLHSQHRIQGNINPQEITINRVDSLRANLPLNPLNEVNSPQNIGSLIISIPGFIPPEQAEGKPVLGSDIYALGLTAIYWLTGKTPDKLPSDLVNGAILWHSYARNLSPEFCRVLDRAIKPDPSERYANAGEMLAELRPLLSISLSDDGPSSLSQETWKRSLISLGIVGISVFAIAFYLGAQKSPESSVKTAETSKTPLILTPSQIPSPSESETASTSLKDLEAEKARLEAENKALKQKKAEQSIKLPVEALPTPEPQKNTEKSSNLPPIVYKPPIPTTYLDLTLTNKSTWRRQMPAKSVVLTFDDGPSPEYTQQVLDILKKHQVKATFFLVGARVRENCPIVQRIVYEGHELGNHSYNHLFLWKNSEGWQRKQIKDTQQAIAECLGSWIPEQYTLYLPRWFRAPYAAQDSNTVAAAHSLGLNTAMWSIDTQDWRKTSSSNSIMREATQTGGRDIILMHDATEAGFNFRHPEAALTRQNTIDALDSLITQLEAQGIKMITIPILIH